MKILSWNICSQNKNQFEQLKLLLKDHPADVICLQEVSLSCCSKLGSFQEYEQIQAIDYLSLKKGQNAEHKLVILSKIPIQNLNSKNKFSIQEITKISLWEKLNRWQESFEFQFVELIEKGKIFKIFNVHLEVAAGPKIRLQQFLKTTEEFDSKSYNLVCGDFNIYGNMLTGVSLGWLMGFETKEIFMNERSAFEALFKKFELQNPFRKKITYPLFRLQLDHILIPAALEIISKTVIKKKYGSDHRPIFIEIKV